jgi:hypothetical protein
MTIGSNKIQRLNGADAPSEIPSSQEGVFRLLAEFYDASCAPHAVQRLNQMKVDVSSF